MVEFNGQEWNIIITRNLPLFHVYSEMVGQVLYAKEYKMISLAMIGIVKNGKRVFYFAEKENMKKYNAAVEMICLSPKRFKELEKTYYKLGKGLLRASAQLENKINLANFKNFTTAYQRLIPSLFLTSAIGRRMADLLSADLKKKLPKAGQQEIDILIGNITYPSKHTPLTESQIELLGIGAILQKNNLSAEKIKNNPLIRKKFKKYIQKYSVIPVNFNEEPWSEEDILKQLQNLMRNNCVDEKENIVKQHNYRMKIRRQELDKINNKRIKQIAFSVQIGTLLNEYRKFVFCRASLAYRPLFKKIAKLYNLSDWKELWKLSPDEITNLYFKKDKNILKIIGERKIAGLIRAGGKRKQVYELMSERDIAPFLSEIEQITPSKYKESNMIEIKGVVANPGLIRGIAKIILGSSDFYKFKDNDIIVTTMTSVDFVPLMKRASAFITNEGGVTSHASIVSRELNKPCIIGTKNATSIIKNGDLVEVDANKGVVKILKK